MEKITAEEILNNVYIEVNKSIHNIIPVGMPHFCKEPALKAMEEYKDLALKEYKEKVDKLESEVSKLRQRTAGSMRVGPNVIGKPNLDYLDNEEW